MLVRTLTSVGAVIAVTALVMAIASIWLVPADPVAVANTVSSHGVAAQAAPRLSPFDRTIARIGIVAMAIGAGLWRRRPARVPGSRGLQPEARASMARAL